MVQQKSVWGVEIIMKELVKVNCYIEEYQNEFNQLSARLRDKETNRKVVLSGNNLDSRHFLQFLSQAKLHEDIMPTVYKRDGVDIVAVRGYVISDTNDAIEIGIDIENGGYLFE